jgi:hypothetical protein
LASGSGLKLGRIAYPLPIGNDGLRLGAAYFDVHKSPTLWVQAAVAF